MLEIAADLTDQCLHSLRTLTFASLEEKAVTNAVRRLDLTGLPVTQAPLHSFAGVAMFSGTVFLKKKSMRTRSRSGRSST